MAITVMKRSSSTDKVPGFKKMSERERREAEERRADLESDLKAKGARDNPVTPPGVTYSIPLRASAEASAEVEEIKTRLHVDDELVARGREKDRNRRERDELARELKGVIPPYHVQSAKPGTPEYSRAVHAGEKALLPENTRKFSRWQHLDRTLEPGDPMAGSVSKIIE